MEQVTTNLPVILGGIVILVLVIIAFVIRMKKNPSTYDKEAANQFLEGLSNTFYKKMMDIINNIKIEDYSSLEELEASVLRDIYSTIWNYVSIKLEEAAKEDILTAMALRVLNEDFIDKFIEKIMTNGHITEKINEAWNTHMIEATSESIKEEDKKVEEQFSDQEQYNENFDNSDLAPAEEEEIPEEELAKLNPQKDEVEYHPEEDDSVEVVEDDDTFIDDQGRKRSKSTGRYVKE